MIRTQRRSNAEQTENAATRVAAQANTKGEAGGRRPIRFEAAKAQAHFEE